MKKTGKLVRPKGHADGTLFDRVVTILEAARANVVRAVNGSMVTAYWLIGREIVLEIQQGSDRAEYGTSVIETLSKELTGKMGRGFSTTNLRYFRTFYSVYANRVPEIRHIGCGESGVTEKSGATAAVLHDMSMTLEAGKEPCGFSPRLGWSHYRELMGVEHSAERLFYEIEAEKEGWEVETLKRQIHTFLFARLLKSRDKGKVLSLASQGQVVEKPSDIIKNPYILDFLGLPDTEVYHESKLESAIIANLQSFLLELGKGTAVQNSVHCTG